MARFGPQLERGIDRALGLDTDGREDDRGRERPADVMLVRACDVRTGVDGRVALAVGVVCPQAASHRASGARESLGAAEDYVRHKCSRADMRRGVEMRGLCFSR